MGEVTREWLEEAKKGNMERHVNILKEISDIDKSVQELVAAKQKELDVLVQEQKKKKDDLVTEAVECQGKAKIIDSQLALLTPAE